MSSAHSYASSLPCSELFTSGPAFIRFWRQRLSHVVMTHVVTLSCAVICHMAAAPASQIAWDSYFLLPSPNAEGCCSWLIAEATPCPVQGQKHALDAAQFIANAAAEHPGKVVVLALGPLTNIALAYKVDAAVRTRLVSSIPYRPSAA